MKRSTRYTSIIFQLFRRDFLIFKEEFGGKMCDFAILLFTNVLVFGYLFPTYGLPSDYGPFNLIGVIAVLGFFEVIGKVSLIITDLEGDQTILYLLSLPLPSWLVFVYIGVSWSTITSIFCLLLFPLGKLLLFTQFSWSKVNLWQFTLVFLMANLLFSFFALWLSSVLKKMSNVNHLFVWVINPMFMFGAYFYSWTSVHQAWPVAGYLHLINPLVYVMEGIRAAMLGQEGYLPFWISLGALIIFTSFFGWDAIRRLQKHLDCVKV